MMDWNKLEIGKKVCPPGSPEGVRFDIFPFGLFLMLRYSDPDGNIRRQVRQGYAQFRAIQSEGFLVFLARFGTLPWQAAAFHIAKAQDTRIPQPSSGRGLPLHILFVDADKGILRVKKILELNPALSQRVVSVLSNQDASDPLPNYDMIVRRIFSKNKPSRLAILANLRDSTD